MDIDNVEAKIRSAVADAKAKGWRIIKDAYYDGKNGCCPLGACILDEIADRAQRAEVACRAAHVLGIEPPQRAIRISIGLDGNVGWCESDELFKLGVRLRDLVDP